MDANTKEDTGLDPTFEELERHLDAYAVDPQYRRIGLHATICHIASIPDNPYLSGSSTEPDANDHRNEPNRNPRILRLT